MTIDLRSDTVTRPSPAMRQAMLEAEVGDIQYDDDPTVNLLQERIADLLGKEAALWMPSGTQANQVGLLLLTRPGDDVIASQGAHSIFHEAGGSAKNAGIQFTIIGNRRGFSAAEFSEAIKPRGHQVYPPTTLVLVENTHNRAGGTIWPQNEIIEICKSARSQNISTYLDGARLWNAQVETGLSLAELADPFDLVMVALTKGLGAPGGSMLAGSSDLIRDAVRFRRMLGGAMRQVGFFAAAALHALDHNWQRLKEDHANARLIAEVLAPLPAVDLDLSTVETNIIYFDIANPELSAMDLVQQAREKGLYMNAMGPKTIRIVTHLDVSTADCKHARELLAELLSR